MNRIKARDMLERRTRRGREVFDFTGRPGLVGVSTGDPWPIYARTYLSARRLPGRKRCSRNHLLCQKAGQGCSVRSQGPISCSRAPCAVHLQYPLAMSIRDPGSTLRLTRIVRLGLPGTFVEKVRKQDRGMAQVEDRPGHGGREATWFVAFLESQGSLYAETPGDV